MKKFSQRKSVFNWKFVKFVKNWWHSVKPIQIWWPVLVLPAWHKTRNINNNLLSDRRIHPTTELRPDEFPVVFCWTWFNTRDDKILSLFFYEKNLSCLSNYLYSSLIRLWIVWIIVGWFERIFCGDFFIFFVHLNIKVAMVREVCRMGLNWTRKSHCLVFCHFLSHCHHRFIFFIFFHQSSWFALLYGFDEWRDC